MDRPDISKIKFENSEKQKFATKSPKKVQSNNGVLPKLTAKATLKTKRCSQKPEARNGNLIEGSNGTSDAGRHKTPAPPSRQPLVPNKKPDTINKDRFTPLNPVSYQKGALLLDLDSELYSARQNRHHIGHYYKNLIQDKILKTQHPTPRLAVETSALATLTVRQSLLKQLEQKDGQFTQLDASRTITNLNDTTIANEADLSLAIHDRTSTNKHGLQESKGFFYQAGGGQASEIQPGAKPLSPRANTARRQPFDINMIEKRKILPQIGQFQSDDSLFGDTNRTESKIFPVMKNIQLSKEQHTFLLNTTDMTAHQSSKAYRTQAKIFGNTQLESILNGSQILDPLAGSSIISHLNTSIRADARDKIHEVVQKSTRERSQQRRRMELIGAEAAAKKPFQFAHRGSLESVHSQSSYVRRTPRTDSMANSSVYQEIVKDLEGFNTFYSKEPSLPPRKHDSGVHSSFYKKEEEDRKKYEELEIGVGSMQPYNQARTDSIGYDQHDLHGKEAYEMIRNPEGHFRKLKAQIKLKSMKKFLEEEQRQVEIAKKKEEESSCQLLGVLKDQQGRVIKQPKHKKPLKNRMPRKVSPPKIRQSFSECQMKYAGARELLSEVRQNKKPAIADKKVIAFMKQVDRYPIPENLLRCPTDMRFELVIDSLINDAYRMESVKTWADYKPGQGDTPGTYAPENSQESDDDFFVEESDESDDPNGVPYLTSQAIKENPSLGQKQFDVRILQTSGFRLETMKSFPHRSTDGEIPEKVLSVKKLKHVFDCLPAIEAQQKDQIFTSDLIQNIFEYYCSECRAAPIKLINFYNYDDPNNPKLSVKNFQLDESQFKALSMVLPYIHDITEIDLNTNHLTDMCAAVLAMAIFMNPYLRRVTIAYNFLRQTFCKTLAKLISMKPEKITDINLMGSIFFQDHIDPFISILVKMNNLTCLNIAGSHLSQGSCRKLSVFMFKCFSLRQLDISDCKINFQGTRYIVDAMNRNTCIRHFNFSHNSLSSPSYEFSVKISSIITRHPCLQHMDISNTSLKREEIMYIVLALPISKTLLSIHLTSDKFPYYERTFLRAAINARHTYQKKNSNQADILGNNEKNMVLTMAEGHVQDSITHALVDRLRDLDEKCKDADLQIGELLAEVDAEATYKEFDPEVTELKDLPEDSKVTQLIKKMVARQKEMEAQQEELQKIYQNEKQNLTEHCEALQGLQDLGMEAFAEAGIPNQSQSKKETGRDEDMFATQRVLRVERHKIRAEVELMRENKERTAGELALMFMGINQIAQDSYAENPMTGYMSETIFSRVLGHDDIEQGEYWADTTQCWVCLRWDKVTLSCNPSSDTEVFKQKVTQIEKLQQAIDKSVTGIIEKEKLLKDVEKVSKSTFSEDEFDDLNDQEIKIEQQSSIKSSDQCPNCQQSITICDSIQCLKGPTNGKAEDTESKQADSVEEGLFPDQQASNILAPIPSTQDSVKKMIYPDGFTEVNSIEYRMPTSEYIEKQKAMSEAKTGGSKSRAPRIQIKTLGSHEGISDYNLTQSALKFQQLYMDSKKGGSYEEMFGSMSNVISQYETKRHKRGEPKIIQRSIFYEGVVYQIEEEIFSDSDCSSVYTSEDSFTVDDELAQNFTEKSIPRQFEETQISCESIRGRTSSKISKTSTKQKHTKDGKSGKNKKQAKSKATTKGASKGGDKSPKPQKPINIKKTFSKEKQAFATDYYVNSQNLTASQKEYEPKTNPKYYRPDLCEKRITHFADKFDNPNIKEVAEYLRKDTPTTDTPSQEAKSKEIFCVASFMDWMPLRMKTLRALNVERFSLDTKESAFNKKLCTLDNKVFLCSQMVPAGVHYFYFVRDKGQIFLSPNYDVVRFKSSNIFLNRIQVMKRLVDIEKVHMARDNDDAEPEFLKDKSVFKDFREDTHNFLRKCFEEDFNFGKIPRTVKKDAEYYSEITRIKEFLFEHYVRINNVFLYYSGCSSYPLLSMNDFTVFAKTTGILDGETIKLTDLDIILTASCNSHHQFVNSQLLDMTRYEFIEMIVRVANERYKNAKITTCEAIEKVLETLIYPNTKQMNGEKFRQYHCYNIRVNEILKKNEAQITRLYESFTHAKKKYITMQECQTFVRKVGLEISEIMVGAIYAESLMTIMDTIRDLTRPNQMKYVEFIVFLCRISHEHYQKSEHADEDLYKKLDHLMPAFLAFMNLQPYFLFGEKFESEIIEAKRRAKRHRNQLRKAFLESKEKGKELDAKTIAQIKAYEASVQRASGQFGSYKNKFGSILLEPGSEEESEDEKEDIDLKQITEVADSKSVTEATGTADQQHEDNLDDEPDHEEETQNGDEDNQQPET